MAGTTARLASWQPVVTGDDAVAVAERAALGTTARVVVWPPGNLGAACAATDDVLGALDRQASRFRADSELSRLHRDGGGLFLLSDGLAGAVGVALAAARWTRGLVDPTVGDAVIRLGYDRDFAAVEPRCLEPRCLEPRWVEPPATPEPAPGWQRVRLDGRVLRLPAGVRLDLGATGKGVAADRAVRAVAAGSAGGVLVCLGGDIAVGGIAPRGGWPVTVAEDPAGADSSPELVRLTGGAVATSSVTCRRWRRGGRTLHHIVDPRTGLPADGPWRTASVGAATCADANAAATAAIVAGEKAEAWLSAAGVAARLVGHDGEVRRLGGWPSAAGQPVPVTRGSIVYAGGLR
jgi:thiamine biosynthesis lipoprotein